MENLVNNKEESVNLNSFSSNISKEVYHKYGLKEVEERAIGRYFTSKGAKVLDVGCGYGRTTKPLFEMGFEVVGTDVVEEMIETAKKENPEIDFMRLSATDMKNFSDESFDYIIFSFNGLDYIYPCERRAAALKEIFRVLKPRGIFILSSHNKMTMFTRISKFSILGIIRNVFNLRIFTDYTITKHQEGDLVTYMKMPFFQKKEFKKAGFEVLEMLGRRHSNTIMINLFEGWPHYVLRKK